MYPVKISLGNLPGNKLRAGMFANVSFDWNSDKENIMIPTKAVAGEAGDNFVFVEQSGKAIRKPVTIGSISGELSSVITGLEPGEKVIITSVADLEDGSPVTLLEDTNPVEVLSNAVQEDAMVTDDIVE
jgi:multidrug efflux pump subunit AcrA (membrane-fusion protein)